MGAWGIGNFENDDAGDWAVGLENSREPDYVIKALSKIIKSSDELQSYDCTEALAAAEIVAADISGDGSRLPDSVASWLRGVQISLEGNAIYSSQDAALAKTVVSKVMQDSELRELWEESGDLDEWEAIQNELLSSFGSVAIN